MQICAKSSQAVQEETQAEAENRKAHGPDFEGDTYFSEWFERGWSFQSEAWSRVINSDAIKDSPATLLCLLSCESLAKATCYLKYSFGQRRWFGLHGVIN